MQLDGDALMDRVTAALGGHDRRLLRELLAPDAHYEDAFLDAPVTGPDAIADHVSRLWQAFPELRVEEAGPCLHDGERMVALPLRALGAHTGPLGSLPSSERFLSLHVVLVCERDRAGRLWRIRLFADRYDAAVQLGVLPASGTVGERAMLALQGFGLLRRR